LWCFGTSFLFLLSRHVSAPLALSESDHPLGKDPSVPFVKWMIPFCSPHFAGTPPLRPKELLIFHQKWPFCRERVESGVGWCKDSNFDVLAALPPPPFFFPSRTCIQQLFLVFLSLFPAELEPFFFFFRCLPTLVSRGWHTILSPLPREDESEADPPPNLVFTPPSATAETSPGGS